MNEPIRIISDLHLGHKISRIDAVSMLRPLIAGAGTVIFNGDTWQELAKPFIARSTVMLEELKQLCVEEGADPIFLSGNHDPGWAGRGWIELAGGKIIVTHGDALLFDGSPWKREILVNGKRVMELWDAHPRASESANERLQVARKIARNLCSVDYPNGRHFIQRAWDAICPPRRAIKMLEAWFNQATAGTRFCEKYFPNAEFLAIGHFHWGGCWRKNGKQVINTGSFTTPGRAHWIEWQDGWLSHGVVDQCSGAYQKGRILHVWRLAAT
jgi:predicted phosphodiesterase